MERSGSSGILFKSFKLLYKKLTKSSDLVIIYGSFFGAKVLCGS